MLLVGMLAVVKYGMCGLCYASCCRDRLKRVFGDNTHVLRP